MSAQAGWTLNERGQCCGRKPLVYKQPTLHYFCHRCARQYDASGKQMQSFLWQQGAGDTFAPRYPEQDYAKAVRQ